MPKDGSVGISDNTPYKQYGFGKILKPHMGMVRGIMRRHAWVVPSYVYVDLTAGSGRSSWEDTIIHGSPIVALDMARSLHVPLHGFLCERDAQSAQSLRYELRHRGLREHNAHPDVFLASTGQDYTLYEGDHQIYAPVILEHLHLHQGQRLYYGLVYSDENGRCPPFDILGAFARVQARMDLLIHVAATPIKRQYYSPIHPLMKRLDQLMETVQKDYWFVREPYGRFQWSFLLGTNWKLFPEFRGIGFHDTRSAEGASILRRLSLNRSAYDAQLDIFAS